MVLDTFNISLVGRNPFKAAGLSDKGFPPSMMELQLWDKSPQVYCFNHLKTQEGVTADQLAIQAVHCPVSTVVRTKGFKQKGKKLQKGSTLTWSNPSTRKADLIS